MAKSNAARRYVQLPHRNALSEPHCGHHPQPMTSEDGTVEGPMLPQKKHVPLTQRAASTWPPTQLP